MYKVCIYLNLKIVEKMERRERERERDRERERERERGKDFCNKICPNFEAKLHAGSFGHLHVCLFYILCVHVCVYLCLWCKYEYPLPPHSILGPPWPL